MRSLSNSDSPNVANEVLKFWPNLSQELRTEGVNLLAGRKEWAKALVAAIEAKKVAAADLNTNVVLRMTALKDKQLDDAILRVWGPVREATADMTKLIDEKRRVLGGGPASFSRGKKVFTDHCAKCHTFDGAGHNVGPALDGAGRDIEYLLVNILDPNRVVGAPYQLRRAILNNGRIEEGMFVGEDGNSVTLKQENDQVKVIARKELEELQVSDKSVMPEGLTKPMSDQDFRDLIRYLVAHPPLTEWEINGATKSLPITSALTLPANGRANSKFNVTTSMTTKMHVGADYRIRILLDKKVVLDRQPDQAIDVTLTAGAHIITVESFHAGDISIRLLDPDRRVTQ